MEFFHIHSFLLAPVLAGATGLPSGFPLNGPRERETVFDSGVLFSSAFIEALESDRTTVDFAGEYTAGLNWHTSPSVFWRRFAFGVGGRVLLAVW